MSVVGKRIVRKEARNRLKGAGLFTDDLKFHGMLHAAIVRSPVARGTLKNVDGKSISEIKGAVGLFTASDIVGHNCIPIVIEDQPFLASKHINYVGEPIAVVVAENRYTARQAARKVKLLIEELPAVLDPLVSRNNPAIHIYREDNTFKHLRIRRGDIKRAFGDCDIILENEYRTPYQEHAYIEPQAMIAIPFPDGSIEVRGSMQCPFYVRKAVTTVLGLPENKVRIVQCATGGAFGGKEDVPSLLACQAALPAFILKRPVKLVYDRTEDMLVTSKRHPSWIRYKSGATKDGTLKAVEVEYVIDGGAYATLSGVVLFRGVSHSVGPYKCENVCVDGYAVATNNVPAGAFRGFGSPQILFAAESQMDQLAFELSMDPVEFRRKNLLRKGDFTITGQRLEASVGAGKTLEKVLKVSGWKPASPKEDGIGFGMSTIYYGVGLGAGGKHLARTGARVMVHADGSVLFSVGTTEIGQGMTTVLSQIVAEELGVPVDWVEMAPVDTSRVPDSGPTVASRSTTMSGNALKDACIKIKSILVSEASHILACNPSKITIDDGEVFCGTGKIPVMDVIKSCVEKKMPLSAEGWHISPPTSWNNDTGQGDAYITYAYATNLAKVRVNKESGEVTVTKFWSAHDIGKSINPALAEGQIEGGVLQGLGYALMEEMKVDSRGKLMNPEFSTYIIPTASDIPEIVPLLVEQPFPAGPFGAKGFGEQPLMGVAPAIANAICDAVGVRINELPITPEKIWEKLKNLK